MKKLTNRVSSVGVLNPQLRVFDIIMETEYGTTYNAYVVKGEQKTALVETVHARFFDEYIENIREVCDPASIDYLIMNHTEPDHSGSVGRLLEINPNIQVVATTAGARFLKGICNCDPNVRVVQDGDTIDLGNATLEFIVAPFLHWPDSMFTWYPEENVLFSCDVFGCHYCEPRMVDTHIQYKERYDKAFRYYYDCIFEPFNSYVRSGLDKLGDRAIKLICPSHGPVLVDTIEQAIERYRAFSAQPEPKSQKQVAIVFVSAYGYTRTLAKHAASVLEEAGVCVQLIDAIDFEGNIAAQVMNADGVLFGSPTINRDALKPIWDVISSLDAVNCAGKPCGVFGSYGWSGEAVGYLHQRLSALKFKMAGDGLKVNFAPSEQDLKNMSEYTAEFLALL